MVEAVQFVAFFGSEKETMLKHPSVSFFSQQNGGNFMRFGWLRTTLTMRKLHKQVFTAHNKKKTSWIWRIASVKMASLSNAFRYYFINEIYENMLQISTKQYLKDEMTKWKVFIHHA